MGGLAGFPFTGITGLGAFLHHVPDEGNVFILYGPHIGVSESGELGKIKRKGMTHETSSCGSLCAAYAALRKKWAKKEMVQLSFDPLDSQQGYVMSRLNACKNAIEWSANPHETVVKTAYGVIDEMMQKVFTDDRTKCSGAVAFVGGIQINTPHGHDDYFLPLNVELCGGKNKERISLLSEVLNS